MTRRLFLLLVFLTACGGAHQGETLRGVTLGDRVDAPGTGASAYATRPSADAVLGPDGRDRVQRGVERAAEGAQMTLVGDGRLALLAGWVGERLGSGGALPPPEVTTFFAHHLGLPEQTPHVLMVGVPDPAAMEAAVHDAVRQYLRRQPYHAYGATLTVRQGLPIAIVALASRPFSLENVARAVPGPRDLPVRGRLGDGLSQPVIEVGPSGGEVQRIPAGRGPDFSVNVPLAADGEVELRIVATSGAGPTVLARFPVYVGVEPPRSIRLGTGASTASDASTAPEVETAMLERMNATRRAQGLPALESHAGLAEVARAHSQDMVEHDFYAHESPTTGSPADRLRRANLSSGLVLENLGRGSDAAAIHAALENSPQHRANLLNRDVTHVGIGVVSVERRGAREWMVTQVFFRITRAIDLEAAPQTLLDAINRARAARSAPALELDPNLGNAALEAARAYLADPAADQNDVLDDATASLRRFAIAYRRVGGVMAVVSSLDEAATLEPTFDPGVRFAGIGVVQGARADLPPNAIVVVYLLAWGR